MPTKVAGATPHTQPHLLSAQAKRISLLWWVIRSRKEVSELVLRYGPEAEVISPDTLRRHIRHRLHAALRRYVPD